jgi:hypothetical protein
MMTGVHPIQNIGQGPTSDIAAESVTRVTSVTRDAVKISSHSAGMASSKPLPAPPTFGFSYSAASWCAGCLTCLRQNRVKTCRKRAVGLTWWGQSLGADLIEALLQLAHFQIEPGDSSVLS